jgi:hypothetical protein
VIEMRRWNEPTEEQKIAYRAWLEERPAHVRAVAARFDPWTMYRLTTTGQRARFIGCDVGFLNCGESPCSPSCRIPSGHGGEHSDVGRVTARIYAEHLELGPISGHGVLGIDPDDLAPWTEEATQLSADVERLNRPDRIVVKEIRDGWIVTDLADGRRS